MGDYAEFPPTQPPPPRVEDGSPPQSSVSAAGKPVSKGVRGIAAQVSLGTASTKVEKKKKHVSVGKQYNITPKSNEPSVEQSCE